jgi:hypothetical protein
LRQTNISFNELQGMLETMKKHNLSLKDQFWNEEKAIAGLKSEILGLTDVSRQKTKTL